jgi:hypothetical protein
LPALAVEDKTGLTQDTWKQFDVTAFVRQQLAGDRVATFLLTGSDEPGVLFEFASHVADDPDFYPQLVLESAPEQPTVLGASTPEDTMTSNGLVVEPAETGTAPTHYRITDIVGGSLYKNDGTTAIENNDFITLAEGAAGLKYRPADDAHDDSGGPFSFKVWAALGDNVTGLSSTAAQAFIEVTDANDAPDAVDDDLSSIRSDSGDRTIPFDDLLGNDSKGPVNEDGQVLTISAVSNPVGGAVRIEGTDVIWTPSASFVGEASFQYTAEDNGVTNGAPDAKTDQATVRFEVESAVAPTPSVSPAETEEDTQSSSGLVVTPNAVGGETTTHYKITEIAGGVLRLADGTTVVVEGAYITKAQGAAGLKFSPNANAHGTTGFGFKVQAAIQANEASLSAAADAVVEVTEANDSPTANDDTLAAIAEDSGERTIPASSLLANDTAGPSDENGQTLIVKSVGNPIGGTVRLEGENMYFTPSANFSGTATFDYTIEDNGTTAGDADPKTDQGTASFSVSPRIEAPDVTPGKTAEDTLSEEGGLGGLVITRHAQDGPEVTHFKITGITGGTLYKNDGTTVIDNGDFITASEGGDGLRFSPASNANGTTGFGFDVQASKGDDGTELSEKKTATIVVTEVNDAPVPTGDTLGDVGINTPKVTIPFADLLANDRPGAAYEDAQQLTIVGVTDAVGGSVTIVAGKVEFLPDANFEGMAQFTYTVRDNGTTDGAGEPKSATAIAKFEVKDVTKPVITLYGDQTVYLLVGTPYFEPGFSAEDDVDQDLTDQVTVTGSVNANVIGTYTIRYNVTDGSGNAAQEATRAVRTVSTDLASLSVGTGTIDPAFAPSSKEYTLSVPNDISALDVTASAVDPTASITIDGVSKDNGGTSAVNLVVGPNDITIVATAQGGATETYTLSVVREIDPLGVQSLAADPTSLTVQAGQSLTSAASITATLNNGTTPQISSGIAWSSADPAVAAVDGNGIVRGVNAGSTTIAATYGGKETQIPITVTAPPIVVEPAPDESVPDAPTQTTPSTEPAVPTVPTQPTQPTAPPASDNVFNTEVVTSDTNVVDAIKAKVEAMKQSPPATASSDAKGHWAEKTLDTFSKLGIIKGYEDGMTKPDQAITRGEFVSILSRIFAVGGTKRVELQDVSGHWAQEEINRFASAGVIGGYGDGTFQPNKTITREEMVVMLSRLVNLSGLSVSTNASTPFQDGEAIASYAKDAVAASMQLGLVDGRDGNRFQPKDHSTRAEALTMILNALNLNSEIKTMLDTL